MARIAASRTNTSDLPDRLVPFDTTSWSSNLALIGFIREYRISTDYPREKADLHAVIGPQEAGGPAVSGFVDTILVWWFRSPHTAKLLRSMADFGTKTTLESIVC